MYLLMKLIHVVAVILFLGNVITGLFWKAHADRTKDLRFITHTMDGIIRADRWFTIPGVILITLAGIFAAVESRLPILGTGWILWSIIAFSASGIAFAWKVAPLQKELLALTTDADHETFDWSIYRSRSRAWELWGLFATLTPLAAVVMMVIKRPV